MAKHEEGPISKTGRAAERSAERSKKTRKELTGDVVGVVGFPKPNGRWSGRMKRMTEAEAAKLRGE